MKSPSDDLLRMYCDLACDDGYLPDLGILEQRAAAKYIDSANALLWDWICISNTVHGETARNTCVPFLTVRSGRLVLRNSPLD